MFESKAGILWIGGVGFFALAFLSNAVVPIMMYRHLPEQSVEQVINPRLRFQFEDMSRRFPESFEKYYQKPTDESLATALRLGRQVYIGEGCWHCHSQFVRPVAQEAKRWGSVAKTEEYQNELQRPVMFGTRRVGPDLSHEGGRHANDWHAVHFSNPKTVVEVSPMPAYPWFFDGDAAHPNRRGIAIMTYVQWLGSGLKEYPYYEELDEAATDDF